MIAHSSLILTEDGEQLGLHLGPDAGNREGCPFPARRLECGEGGHPTVRVQLHDLLHAQAGHIAQLDKRGGKGAPHFLMHRRRPRREQLRNHGRRGRADAVDLSEGAKPQ